MALENEAKVLFNGKVVDDDQLEAGCEARDADDIAAQLDGEPVETVTKRKGKKLSRQNSKENQNQVTCNYINVPRSWKNSRRSRNGYGRGLPKKGGAGGKGVWGAYGSELLETYEDVNDPNYDYESNIEDVELKVVIPEITYAELKKKVDPIVLEYFENGDTSEAAFAVRDAIPQNHRDGFVQLCIEIAMDHKSSHREMTSVLISDLYGDMINQRDIEKAFETLLSNLSDLILDIPDAPVVLGNFIARAIADDCIPPAFIKSCEGMYNEHREIKEALHRADTLLSMKHGLVRLHNVWGVGGALRPVKNLTRQMNLLLNEYISSRDAKEASRCLRHLEVPHFHHELVYEAIVMALEANSVIKEEALCHLLKVFDEEVLLTPDQMERGFFRVYDDLRDIHMDVPLAYIILDRFVDRCSKEGFISEAVITKLPSKGRKRFVSEGDQLHFRHARTS